MSEFEASVLAAIREAVDAVRSKIGVVQSFSSPTVNVNVDGAMLTLHRLASYTSPASGDLVLIDRSVGGQWVVLGKIV